MNTGNIRRCIDSGTIGTTASDGRSKAGTVVFGALHGVVDFDVGMSCFVAGDNFLHDRGWFPKSPVGKGDRTRTFFEFGKNDEE